MFKYIFTLEDFVVFWLTLWACYLFAEQQTIALLLAIKSSYTAMSASIAATSVYLVLGSATVRSYASLPEFLYHLTYITQTRYSGAILNQIEFFNRTSLVELQWEDDEGRRLPCQGNTFGFGCRSAEPLPPPQKK